MAQLLKDRNRLIMLSWRFDDYLVAIPQIYNLGVISAISLRNSYCCRNLIATIFMMILWRSLGDHVALTSQNH